MTIKRLFCTCSSSPQEPPRRSATASGEPTCLPRNAAIAIAQSPARTKRADPHRRKRPQGGSVADFAGYSGRDEAERDHLGARQDRRLYCRPEEDRSRRQDEVMTGCRIRGSRRCHCLHSVPQIGPGELARGCGTRNATFAGLRPHVMVDHAPRSFRPACLGGDAGHGGSWPPAIPPMPSHPPLVKSMFERCTAGPLTSEEIPTIAAIFRKASPSVWHHDPGSGHQPVDDERQGSAGTGSGLSGTISTSSPTIT